MKLDKTTRHFRHSERWETQFLNGSNVGIISRVQRPTHPSTPGLESLFPYAIRPPGMTLVFSERPLLEDNELEISYGDMRRWIVHFIWSA